MSCQCLNGDGYKSGEDIRASAVNTAANLRLAQMIVMAIDNSNQLISNYKKQNDIADAALKMSEQNQHHLKTTFWTRELQFLSEFCSPEEIEEVEAMGRRYAGRLVSMVAAQFAKQLNALRCNASKYCSSATGKAFQDLSLARSQAIANARVLGRMMAFKEHQQFDDLTFARRIQAAGLGDGLIGQAANFMGKGTAGYSQIGQSLAGRLSDNITGIGQAFEMRNKPPPRSREMVSMWDAAMARQPYVPASTTAAGTSDVFNMDFSAPEMDFKVDTTNLGVYKSSDSASLWQSQQNQTQMNNGRIGNWDLAREGTKTYTDYDTYGKPINITVKMSDFPLKYMDSKTEGDK